MGEMLLACREPEVPYAANFTPEKPDLSQENPFFWDESC